MKKLIYHGAESKVYYENGIIIKERIKKDYRHERIDSYIRKHCTRGEARLLEKALKIIPVPKVLDVCEKECIIRMEFIDGERIKEHIGNISGEERGELFKRIGRKIAKMHNENIIHGDLTTTNMILSDKIYFVDFGLGFVSTRIEDKAVDIHLLKQALESKHWRYAEQCFKALLEGYKEESREFDAVMKRLEKVEKRGRYKYRLLSAALEKTQS
ncbi:Kae1-associated serine/threonine protein kinase [archaeon]|nr:Kae1-associated serine/threonine protein kinase [archaeon]